MSEHPATDAAVARAERNELRAAADHCERLSDETDKLIDAQESAKDEIREAFALIGQIPIARIALPQVHIRSGGGFKVGSESMLAACLELIQDWTVDDELAEVIEKSDCPLVGKLRIALRDKYIERNALEVAEARQ